MILLLLIAFCLPTAPVTKERKQVCNWKCKLGLAAGLGAALLGGYFLINHRTKVSLDPFEELKKKATGKKYYKLPVTTSSGGSLSRTVSEESGSLSRSVSGSSIGSELSDTASSIQSAPGRLQWSRSNSVDSISSLSSDYSLRSAPGRLQGSLSSDSLSSLASQ